MDSKEIAVIAAFVGNTKSGKAVLPFRTSTKDTPFDDAIATTVLSGSEAIETQREFTIEVNGGHVSMISNVAASNVVMVPSCKKKEEKRDHLCEIYGKRKSYKTKRN